MIADRFADPKVLDRSRERIPWHRAGRLETIAGAILRLNSDDADDVAGHTLVIDRGPTMQWSGAWLEGAPRSLIATGLHRTSTSLTGW